MEVISTFPISAYHSQRWSASYARYGGRRWSLDSMPHPLRSFSENKTLAAVKLHIPNSSADGRFRFLQDR